MKKRFFIITFLISLIAILVFAVFMTDIYYNNSLKYAKGNLEVYMNQFDSERYSLDSEGANAFSQDLNGARITFMMLDGTIIADSKVENLSENHASRKEVMTAIQEGKGFAVRSSESVGTNYLYYCVKMESDNVLVRIAIPTSSSMAIFLDAIPTLLWFLAVEICLCGLFAWFGVDFILKPVEQIAKDSALGKNPKSCYKELDSFVDIINQNNETIAKKMQNIQENKRIETLILDNMDHGMVILNASNEIILINHTASTLLGVEKFENTVCYFMMDKEIKNALDTLEECLTYRRIENKYYAIRISFNDTAKVILITDCTEVKRAEKSKNDFIANVTHEMNTPLTSIKGYTELLQSGALSEEKAKHACEVILKQTNRLSLLIKNIINYSALENDELPNEMINISSIVEGATHNLEAAMKQKGITLSKNIEPEIMLSTRYEKVSEVITNLLTNAIKYNKENGSIDVFLQKEEDGILLKVSDTGIGIAEEDKDKVFDRFYTVDKSHNEYTSGFGLGLAIVKKICSQSGWKIKLESTLNEGTTFKILMK